MASKTFKQDKKGNGFSVAQAYRDAGKYLPSKEERNLQMDEYHSKVRTLENLKAVLAKNPEDEVLAKRILERARELEEFVKNHPAVASRLEWERKELPRLTEERKAENRRKASIEMEARNALHAKRNSLELLKSQQEAKKKADAEARKKKAIAKILAIHEEERIQKAKAEEEAKKNLIEEIQKALGGYAY